MLMSNEYILVYDQWPDMFRSTYSNCSFVILHSVLSAGGQLTAAGSQFNFYQILLSTAL
jgi:hypothetical protein